MANFNATGSTSNSISVAVTGMDTGFAGTRAFEWYLNSNYVGDTTIPPYTGEAYFSYRGLSSNTWYHLDVKIYNSDKSMMYAHLSTDAATAPAPVESWHWTDQELYALKNHGHITAITYSRWNEFCERVNATCVAAGSSWLNDFGSFEQTKMTYSDKLLYANKFNAVRYNIGSRVSTGIGTVYRGSKVYGSYFITLQDKLN